ncbi:MAG TPA: NifU family protein [Amycolatopsis sp.]|nr:NifU family protein [Amycolatopsis sp.]
MTTDRGAIEDAVAELNQALRSHGGGVEWIGTTEQGALRLRMIGMCAGCGFRPVSTAATIRPFFRERLDMAVEVEGARISAEAEQRLAQALAPGYHRAGLRPLTGKEE